MFSLRSSLNVGDRICHHPKSLVLPITVRPQQRFVSSRWNSSVQLHLIGSATNDGPLFASGMKGAHADHVGGRSHAA